MLEGVRDMTGHWPASAIHFESFLDAGAAQKPEDRPFTVVLAQSGSRIEVAPGVSILEAMRAQGFDAPSSCESGTCGTCRTPHHGQKPITATWCSSARRSATRS